MGERHPEYVRADDDWYVEPRWVADDLFHRVKFTGIVHDPCCGIGTIVGAGIAAGVYTTGSDLVRRDSHFMVRDFFGDWSPGLDVSIVTNPPYNKAHDMALHAFKICRPGAKICFLTQLKFLASQRRFELWPQVTRVIIYSKRPSMPPGEMLAEQGESCRGGGSIDFCWVVWQIGHTGPATIEWSLGDAEESH